MDKTTLNKILEDHKTWLEGVGGKQADLSNANLRDADLHHANLRNADLHHANLRNADLQNADLRGAYLCGADLCDTDMRNVDLRGANLWDADLRNANLHWADLRGANLYHTDMIGADLRDANFSGADLHNAYLSQKIVQVGPIGSRRDYTIYRVDEDIVQCGCWKESAGGSLADFIARINEAYPEDNKDGAKYRREYLAAIAMFQALREDYLKDSQRDRTEKGVKA